MFETELGVETGNEATMSVGKDFLGNGYVSFG